MGGQSRQKRKKNLGLENLADPPGFLLNNFPFQMQNTYNMCPFL